MNFNPLWEEIYSNRDWGKYPNEEVVRFIALNLYKLQRNNISILELGCGTGANLWFIAREGFKVYGIDGSKSAILKCIERLNSEVLGWKGDIIEGDMINLPFQSEVFDAVIDCKAIYCNNFQDSKKIIHEAFRVLKKDGLFLSLTFSKGCIGDETGIEIEKNFYYPTEWPFKGMGAARFTAEEEINELYSPFKIVSLESNSRSYNNMKNYLKEFIITCQK